MTVVPGLASEPGGDTEVTSTRPRAATAVMRPKVMAVPLLSAIEPAIIPAIPSTKTHSTTRRTRRGLIFGRPDAGAASSVPSVSTERGAVVVIAPAACT